MKNIALVLALFAGLFVAPAFAADSAPGCCSGGACCGQQASCCK